MSTVTIKLIDEKDGVSVYMTCDEDPDKNLTPAMLMGASFAEFVTALRTVEKYELSPVPEQSRCH